MEKLQGDKGFGVGRGKITAQAAFSPRLAAALPEQGIDDGVKQGGFARAGVPCNQKKPGFEGTEIHLRPPGIGAEGGKGQHQRFHSVSSLFPGAEPSSPAACAACRESASAASCAAVRSAPVISL